MYVTTFYYEMQAEHSVNCFKFCFVCGVYLDQMSALTILVAEWSVLRKFNILKKSIYLLLFPSPLIVFM
jgi:hypothetical protein